MNDIAISIHTDDGKIHDIDAPADIRTQDCLQELVQGLQLSSNGTGISPAEWRLLDRNTGIALDLKLTLEQNGVRPGHALSLQKGPASDAPVCSSCHSPRSSGSKFCRSCGQALGAPQASSDDTIYVLTTDKKTHPAEVALQIKAGALLAEFSDDAGPSLTAGEAPAPVYLVHQESGIALDSAKSLAENGVRSGDHLCVRQAATPLQMVSPPEKTIVAPRRQTTSKAGKLTLTALSILFLLGIVGFLTYNHRPPSISIHPNASSLWAAQRQEFKASFADETNGEIEWSVSPEIGSISPQGLYSAPSSIDWARTLQVTARVTAHPKIFATATILLQKSALASVESAESQPTPIEIILSPSSASLWAQEQQKFTARIRGSANSAVVWSVDPAIGAISMRGLYTAPSRTMARRYVKVMATSQADATKSAVAIVTLKPSIAGR